MVDGGRTHLRFFLFDRNDQNGQIIARSERTGLPLTLNSVGAWVDLLLDSTSHLVKGVGKTPTEICVASAGLAGLGRSEDCDFLAQALAEAGSPFPWLIESDAHMTLRAASESGPVVVGLLGTGSVFFARDEAGILHRVGGWGALFEDAGSGFEIARQALLHIFRIDDGLEADSSLKDQFLMESGISSLQDLRGELYRGSTEISQWAGYAPLVLSLAEKGDPSARQIVLEQVDKVVRSLVALIQKAKLPEQAPIVFAGGLVQGSHSFYEMLQTRLIIALPAHPVHLLQGEAFQGGWRQAQTWLQTHLPRGLAPK